MPYVDKEYYESIFKGEPVDDTDFSPLCERAEGIIEEITRYRLNPVTFLVMNESVQERVKNRCLRTNRVFRCKWWS